MESNNLLLYKTIRISHVTTESDLRHLVNMLKWKDTKAVVLYGTVRRYMLPGSAHQAIMLRRLSACHTICLPRDTLI
jgi:hypothetical protein